MPEYKNNSTQNVTIKDKDGNPFILEPGKTKETWYYSDDSNLEKLSDHPLWSPMALEPTDVDLSALTTYASDIDEFEGAVIPVPEDAWHIYIMKISGSITVMRQAPEDVVADSPVEMLEKIDAYPYIAIAAAGTMDRLLVSGSGTFQIQMYRKPITD